MKHKRILLRVLGNFGSAFFGPLVGGTAANNIYDINITLEQQLVVAFIASLFVTGLTLSRELEKKYAK